MQSSFVFLQSVCVSEVICFWHVHIMTSWVSCLSAEQWSWILRNERYTYKMQICTLIRRSEVDSRQIINGMKDLKLCLVFCDNLNNKNTLLQLHYINIIIIAWQYNEKITDSVTTIFIFHSFVKKIKNCFFKRWNLMSRAGRLLFLHSGSQSVWCLQFWMLLRAMRPRLTDGGIHSFCVAAEKEEREKTGAKTACQPQTGMCATGWHSGSPQQTGPGF